MTTCRGWLRSEAVLPPMRYFVPEERAAELEQALRDSDAAIDLTCGPDGQPVIGDLYLDGVPWLEAVGR